MRWLPNPNLWKSSKETIKHQIRGLAQVMAILELAKVSPQVLLRNPNVSPVDSAFHVSPKAFNRIRVNVTACILFR
jgi:hypothetical protein